MRYWTLLRRSLRLKCCLCGKGALFRGWLRMHRSCSHCQHVFEREPGFFLGSVYINYGLTALLICVVYPILRLREIVPPRPLLIGATVFMIVFPIWFFRYARALWCAFDEWVDPVRADAKTAQMTTEPEKETTADSGD